MGYSEHWERIEKIEFAWTLGLMEHASAVARPEQKPHYPRQGLKWRRKRASSNRYQRSCLLNRNCSCPSDDQLPGNGASDNRLSCSRSVNWTRTAIRPTQGHLRSAVRRAPQQLGFFSQPREVSYSLVGQRYSGLALLCNNEYKILLLFACTDLGNTHLVSHDQGGHVSPVWPTMLSGQSEHRAQNKPMSYVWQTVSPGLRTDKSPASLDPAPRDPAGGRSGGSEPLPLSSL
jgi:hypothetical protein